jgi:hypothetical protein
MCGHSTKRLYFPDAVEPDTQYDKYPILIPQFAIAKTEQVEQIKPIPPITMEMRMRETWDEWIAQKRNNYYRGL